MSLCSHDNGSVLLMYFGDAMCTCCVVMAMVQFRFIVLQSWAFTLPLELLAELHYFDSKIILQRCRAYLESSGLGMYVYCNLKNFFKNGTAENQITMKDTSFAEGNKKFGLAIVIGGHRDYVWALGRCLLASEGLCRFLTGWLRVTCWPS